MRFLVLPYAAWMGALPLTVPLATDFPRLLATAGVLGSLTVLVYRLGVWRQEMENTKTNVGAELRLYREESSSSFARVERQLDALKPMTTDYTDFKQEASRWRRRTERRLHRLEEER